MLSTARKIAIARGLGAVVRSLRAIAGRRGSEARCRRRGLQWSLDLNEGVQLALYLGVYERPTMRALERLVRRGATVIDIGANVGAHALTLAQAVGPAGIVVAVEPTDAAFARLERNRGLNPQIAERLRPVQAALVGPGETAPGEFYASWDLVGDGERHEVHRGTKRSAGRARALTLDALVAELDLSRVDLLKIDVDGSELPVLRGATSVLARHRPAIVMEVCPHLLAERGASVADVLAALEPYGYQLVDERRFAPLTTDPVRLAARIPRGAGINVVAQLKSPQPRRP
jgi:FkbM family methyltransferase